MSKESARTFVERMKADSEFARTVGECWSLEDVQALIREAGYDFTREELDSLGGELVDDELDQVSGGKGRRRHEYW